MIDSNFPAYMRPNVRRCRCGHVWASTEVKRCPVCAGREKPTRAEANLKATLIRPWKETMDGVAR